MQTKLFESGNSCAIIIDKEARRRLGIKAGSLLHYFFEGNRLVIERSVDDACSPEKIARVAQDKAIREVTTLLRDLDTLGLSKSGLEKSSYEEMRFGEIHAEASLGRPLHPITVLRLERCVARQRAFKESLEASIDFVIANTPSPLALRRRGREPRRSATSSCRRRAARAPTGCSSTSRRTGSPTSTDRR